METKTILGILGTLAIACAFVFGLIVTEHVDTNSTPLISTVLGFVSIVLIFLTGGKVVTDRIDKVDSKVDRVLNGEMEEKIRAVVHSVLSEHEEAAPTDVLPLSDPGTNKVKKKKRR